MPTLKDVVDLLHGWYPPDDGRLVGRRRAGVRRPGRSRSARCCSRSTRRVEVARRGGRVGRRPAGRPPPAVPQGRARRRRDHAQGPHAGHPRRRRLRAAHRAHQRRPGRGRGVRGAGARRSGSPTSGRSGRCRQTPLDKLDRLRPGGRRRRGAAAPWPRRAPAGSATTTAASFSTPGEGRFRPLEGAHPTIGGVGALEVVDEVRIEVVLARAAAVAGRRGDAGRAPLRGAGVRRRRAGRRRDRAAPGIGRIGTVDADDAAGLRRQVASGAARHRARRAGRRRPGPGRRAGWRVCGGAGDFLLDDGARHRRRRLRDQRPAAPPGERSSLEHGGPALVDVAHWAAEWTWLPGWRRGWRAP